MRRCDTCGDEREDLVDLSSDKPGEPDELHVCPDCIAYANECVMPSDPPPTPEQKEAWRRMIDKGLA